MSVPHYYQSGVLMSATMKADYKRIRAKHAKRYQTRVVDEQRMSEGQTFTVKVEAQPDALPMTPRQRHDLATGKR